MALKFGQARGEDVADLIARKQYPKAIEIIKAQLSAQKDDARIRLQLADVLVQAGAPGTYVLGGLPHDSGYPSPTGPMARVIVAGAPHPVKALAF